MISKNGNLQSTRWVKEGDCRKNLGDIRNQLIKTQQKSHNAKKCEKKCKRDNHITMSVMNIHYKLAITQQFAAYKLLYTGSLFTSPVYSANAREKVTLS